MIDIRKNIQTVQNHIYSLEQRYNRPHGSVGLVAVSKFHPSLAIQTALKAGLTHFGENYLQEALLKISALHTENITWHFIGLIQSNKTGHIAKYFSWVHTIDKLKIAQRLSDARPPMLPDLNICLQVNLDHAPNKGGILASELFKLAHAVHALPHLRLRGLMTLPDLNTSFVAQQAIYGELQQLKEDLNKDGIPLDTLSMGTSHDLEAAISMGATIVRVGTTIFGPRIPIAKDTL